MVVCATKVIYCVSFFQDLSNLIIYFLVKTKVYFAKESKNYSLKKDLQGVGLL